MIEKLCLCVVCWHLICISLLVDMIEDGRKVVSILRVFGKGCLLIFLTIMGLVASVGTASGQTRCEAVWLLSQKYTLEALPMLETYRGEERGLYLDPLTNKPWAVKYFSPVERAQFEMHLKEGLFLNSKGEKMDSPYDNEALSHDTGLIVIDANKKLFFLPFEVRGKYHHSSLTAGKKVLFAGMASFSNGALNELNSDSGHYKPNSIQTLKTIRMLHEEGVNLNRLKITGRAAYDLSKTYSLSYKELTVLFPKLFSSKTLSEEDFLDMTSPKK